MVTPYCMEIYLFSENSSGQYKSREPYKIYKQAKMESMSYLTTKRT